ncbi:hypothetical protein GH714_022279 [Hevea brasiliensis]|uniref:Leucine-rich repeat-containing N-terminal plant-type domain-containing protein n=1 Tax=Hevea brasiliensis TaxID=3981 RepID=A0A6A6MM68_HEVBR|nr:hypothetical protein GH714_022279 [Hevea brasiliensis]
MSAHIKSRRTFEAGFTGFWLVTMLLVYASEGLNSEGQYLLDLKNGLHDELDHLNNWKSTDLTPCGWIGVNCTSDYEPVRLNICNNRISGSFPVEFGNLSSLIEVVAYTNNLTGPLPHSIGNLKNLKIFRAGQNGISGSIPAEISGCQSLQLLGLAQNAIGGELPKEFGMLGV